VAAPDARPPRSFTAIWNMSFGFFGIQFGWALQMANMSAIYEYLGANAHEIPILWLAAPLTGLIVQPIIGHLSDRTWTRLGRRRPYFLVGAVCASTALVLMPNASTLLAAAALLWLMDASINVSMEPFRAFVADLLSEKQRTRGFTMQALFIGLGAVVASMMPWLLGALLGVEGARGEHAIPRAVRISFYTGAVAFLGAVVWTVVTTKEEPPADLAAFEREKAETAGLGAAARAIFADARAMPAVMKQLAPVQIFTWLGLFCMWLYFGVAVARTVFHGEPGTKAYAEGIAWGGNCFAAYSAVCFGFSFVLPSLAAKVGRRRAHAACLVAGALGLVSVAFIRNKYALFGSMVGVGIAWASILSMPYAILTAHIPPAKTGIYMGIFNFFIVIPEIVAALGFGKLMETVLGEQTAFVQLVGGDSRLAAVVVGGAALFVAALLVAFVRDEREA